jgi:hypothetical protein
VSIQDAATIQALAAVVIVLLTVGLVYTAFNALIAAKKQANAAEAAIQASIDQGAEMRKDRHFANVPVLKVQLEKVDTSVVNQVSVVMHLLNKNDAPALNVHVWLTDCINLYQPNAYRLSTATGVPLVVRENEYTIPVDLSRFTLASPPRVLRTDWVYINVQYEGLLGAKVTQEWYWEPHEWEGLAEPVTGHGEKLVLHRVTGTSGAEADDIRWERAA